jgi:hypothetical protein
MIRIAHRISRIVQWVWANTDTIAKWVQIVALFVAAYWAYTRFLTGEKPTLEERVDVSTALTDERPGPFPGTCYVYFNLKLRNQGIASFDTDGVHIQAWRSDMTPPSSAIATYIDPLEFEHGQKIVDVSDAKLLNMHFGPGESAERDFAWVFHAEPPGVYFFSVDIDSITGHAHKHIHAETWSQSICVRK